MARADLVKRLFVSYQQRDDDGFRVAASEIVEEERRKQHPVLANELQRLLVGSVTSFDSTRELRQLRERLPMDSSRKIPLACIRSPDRYLDDLVLQGNVAALVERVIAEARGWEILEVHGLQPSRHLLFCGPSGCGKTACAEAISSELALPLLYVRFDGIVSSLLGETAANLRKLFDFAARGQWVVFFDEFDAIGRSRDDATEHGEIKRVVNSFLQLLDGFEGRSLIIAATNFEQALDPAVWRRFDDVLRFPLPGRKDVEELSCKRLRPLQPTSAQVKRLVDAVVGTSYADVERVCLDARKICVLAGSATLRDEDLRTALERFQHRQDAFRSPTPGSAPTIDRE